VLTRVRHESEGMLNVTSRDVKEAEYALELHDGVAWTLTGGTLDASRARASDLRTSAGLGDRTLEVLAYVRDNPAGVSPKQVEEALDIAEARQYLKRLADKGRISNPKRGIYRPLVPPVTTVTVSQPEGSSLQGDTCDTGYEGRRDHERARLRAAEAME